MTDWSLILAAIGQVIAIGALGLAAFSAISRQLDRRFAGAESLRAESGKHWDERFDVRDRVIDELSRRLDANQGDHTLLRTEQQRLSADVSSLRIHVAESYVPRDVYLEALGMINIKLDKLAERLPSQPRNP